MFFAFVLSVLALNLYDWWRIRCAFLKSSGGLSMGLLVVILMLVFTPALLRLAGWLPAAARGWVMEFSWIWLALSFMLGFAFFVLDAWNLLVYVAAFLRGTDGWLSGCLRLVVTPFAQGCAALAYLGFAVTFGFLEAQDIRVRRVELSSPLVPASVGEYRIALVADLHLGPAANWPRIRRTVKLVNEADADLLLSAGDLIDGYGEREQAMARHLSECRCRSGRKLAVIGNHDVYSGVDHSRMMHELAGLELLEERSETIDGWLFIHGLRDPAYGGRAVPGDARHQPTFAPIPDHCFSILLEHRPDVFPEMPPYGLILSGHTHNGQIFPFNYLVKLQYPRPIGRLVQLERGMRFYNTPGTGLWGPPFRLLAPPEVTLFVLRHQEP